MLIFLFYAYKLSHMSLKQGSSKELIVQSDYLLDLK